MNEKNCLGYALVINQKRKKADITTKLMKNLTLLKIEFESAPTDPAYTVAISWLPASETYFKAKPSLS